jgi:hypothetical protein
MTLEANFTPFAAIIRKYIENVLASMCSNSHWKCSGFYVLQFPQKFGFTFDGWRRELWKFGCLFSLICAIVVLWIFGDLIEKVPVRVQLEHVTLVVMRQTLWIVALVAESAYIGPVRSPTRLVFRNTNELIASIMHEPSCMSDSQRHTRAI